MQNKKILIADDVEMNRDLLTDILEDDYGIETVDDGESDRIFQIVNNLLGNALK